MCNFASVSSLRPYSNLESLSKMSFSSVINRPTPPVYQLQNCLEYCLEFRAINVPLTALRTNRKKITSLLIPLKSDIRKEQIYVFLTSCLFDLVRVWVQVPFSTSQSLTVESKLAEARTSGKLGLLVPGP